MTANVLIDEIRDMQARIREAEASVNAGKEIDAAALDAEIAALCDRAAAGDPAEAPATREALEGLRIAVGGLAQVLDRRLETMRETLNDTQRRRQAVSAYGMTSGSGGEPSR